MKPWGKVQQIRHSLEINFQTGNWTKNWCDKKFSLKQTHKVLVKSWKQLMHSYWLFMFSQFWINLLKLEFCCVFSVWLIVEHFYFAMKKKEKVKFKVILKADFKISLERSSMGSGIWCCGTWGDSDSWSVHSSSHSKWLFFLPLII